MMNKKGLKIYYILIVLSGIFISGFILQSCNSDPPNKGPNDIGFLPLGEAKDYVYFKKGTWWVYQNSRTGQFDTIEVYFNFLDTIEQSSEKWHFTNEVFSVKSKSLTSGHEYNFYMRSLSAVVTTFKWGCIPNLERREPFEGDLNPFYYPFNLIEKGSSAGTGLQCTTIKDTMILYGKTYSKVAVFFIKNDFTEPAPHDSYASKYYWAKNVGLIQKDLFDIKYPGDTSTLYHSWKLINSLTLQ